MFGLAKGAKTKNLIKSVDTQMKVIRSGAEQILPENELAGIIGRSIEKSEPLKVKLGVDPTRPDLHIGHAVPLRKLKDFQDLGHIVILIIGDFTALIGDPSGRDVTRPSLTASKIAENARTYADQAFRILDKDFTVLEYNSKWLSNLNFEAVLKLTSNFTVARMLERDDFKERYDKNVSIGLHEFLYPIMQAYDSVALEADIEIGGTDQVFNLLAGRDLQKAFGQKQQMILTLPLLIGLDGTKKMSKSYDNHIALDDPPDEMFGKVMSIKDEQIVSYMRLAGDMCLQEIEEAEASLKRQIVNPSEIKRDLAESIVRVYYDSSIAEKARVEFDRVHRHRMTPDDVDEALIEMKAEDEIWICALIKDLGLAGSTSEAKRLLSQGAIKADGKQITDDKKQFCADELNGIIISRGRRVFKKVKVEFSEEKSD